MKVGENSSQLRDIREENQNQIGKLKESYESQIKNLKETSELSLDELRKNNEEKRKSLIEENQDKIEIVNNKTNKLINERRESYKNSLMNEKDQFRKDRLELTGDFQQKLGNIKSSYDDALTQHKYISAEQLRNTNDNLNNKLEISQNNSNKKIKDIETESRQTIKDLREDLSQQKKNLVHKSRDEKDFLNKDHSLDKKNMRDYYDKKLQILVDNRDEEVRKINEKYEFALNSSRNDDRNEIDRIAGNYKDAVDRITNVSQEDYKKLQEKFIRERNDDNREHQEQTYLLNKEKDEIVDRSLRGEGVEFQKQELRDKYENRLDGMNDLMFDQRVKFEKDLTEMKRHVDSQVKEKNFSERQNIDRLKNEFNTNLYSNIERTRREQGQLETDYNRKIRNQDAIHEESTLRTDKQYKDMLDRQRSYFGENVQKLEESNLENVKKLQHEYALEKKEIFDITKRSVDEQLKYQREEYNRKVEKLVESYENKFQKQQQDLDRLKVMSEAQIEKHQKNSAMRQSAENKYFASTSKQQLSDMKDRTKEMHNDYERELKAARFNFDNEVAKIRRENDVHNTRLIQKYEQDKQKMIADHQQELRTKLSESDAKLQRVIKDGQFQKNTIVETYETRLKELKRAYELEQVKGTQS